MNGFVSNDTYGRAVLQEELQDDEGVRSTMYQDSRGFWTVGVGHNLSIPQSEFTISALFEDDCNGAEASLDLHWPWWRQLDPVRQRVMLNMMFNMGAAKLAEFVHFLAAMEVGDWPEAAAQMIPSPWATQVGARATRLRDMVLTGIDPRAPSTTGTSS
jgi:lysozyme